jgi:hypothetical protein
LLNGASEQQKLFRYSRFARIGMADDGESSSAFYFLLIVFFH